MSTDNNLNQEVLDKVTKVCICKAISRKTIKDAIKNGADTFEKIQETTGAGTGSCRGMRCKDKILELIDDHKEGLF